MNAFKKGGNPLTDRKESMERYQVFIKPVLGAKGFEKIRGNSHTMVCHGSKTVVVPKSAPSDTKHVREMKALTRELRKKYDGYGIYVIFHRDKAEWLDKPIYMNTLRRIMDIKSLNGVICGIDNFSKSLNDICGNTLTFKI